MSTVVCIRRAASNSPTTASFLFSSFFDLLTVHTLIRRMLMLPSTYVIYEYKINTLQIELPAHCTEAHLVHTLDTIFSLYGRICLSQ